MEVTTPRVRQYVNVDMECKHGPFLGKCKNNRECGLDFGVVRPLHPSRRGSRILVQKGPLQLQPGGSLTPLHSKMTNLHCQKKGQQRLKFLRTPLHCIRRWKEAESHTKVWYSQKIMHPANAHLFLALRAKIRPAQFKRNFSFNFCRLSNEAGHFVLCMETE